jgi:hypothetical protein
MAKCGQSVAARLIPNGLVHCIFEEFFKPKCDAFSADIIPFDFEILIFHCAPRISPLFLLTFVSLTSYSCFEFSVSFHKIELLGTHFYQLPQCLHVFK